MRYFIGVDVGGTTTTLAVGNDRRDVVYMSEQFETHSAEGPEAVIRTIVEQAQRALKTLGGDFADVEAGCIATPGPATYDGVLLKSPNLDPRIWDRFPIRGALEEALRAQHAAIRVHYLGDGQAAALGEFAIRNRSVTWDQLADIEQPGDELASLFMVIVGTGLGGGAVQEGRAVRGSEGRAGHAGHTFLPPDAFRYEHDRRLLVGNAYCTVESAVSLTALTHQLGYRLTLEPWSDHPLRTAAGSTRDKAKQLRGLAANGDELALELFEDQAKALGLGLLNVNYIGDFDLLVIGGGVCDLTPKLRDWYRQLAEESYRQHALDGFGNLAGFEFSVCGDNAPVIGALASIYAA